MFKLRKISRDLKDLIEEFYWINQNNLNPYKKEEKKNIRFLIITMTIISFAFLLITILIHVFFVGKGIYAISFIDEEGNPAIANFLLVEIIFAVFSILSILVIIRLIFMRKFDSEGKWIMKRLEGSCKMYQLYEDYFIPNKIDTNKEDRKPISWTEVQSINLERMVKPSYDSDIPNVNLQCLKIKFKDGREPKLIPIIFPLKHEEFKESLILLKKFLEFLIQRAK